MRVCNVSPSTNSIGTVAALVILSFDPEVILGFGRKDPYASPWFLPKPGDSSRFPQPLLFRGYQQAVFGPVPLAVLLGFWLF